MPISDEMVKAADAAYMMGECNHECTIGAVCTCMRAALEAAEAVRGRTEVEAFKWLEEERADLRCKAYPTGMGDADVGWEIVKHYMAKPIERTVGMGNTPLAAVQDAMLASSGGNRGQEVVTDTPDQESDGPYTCIRCCAGTWNDNDLCDECAGGSRE